MKICKEIGYPNLCKLIKLSNGLMSFFLEILHLKYSVLCKESLETQTTLLEMPLPDPENDK